MALLKLNSLQIASAPINRKRTTLIAAGLDLALEGQGVQVVAPGQDPISVISAALEEAPSNELHLVAHGAPGQIALGAGIDRAGLLERAELIGSWGVKQINLWSCRVGADQAFIATLEELSGARVVASTEALGQGKTLNGSNFPELEEAVKGLAWELANPVTVIGSGNSTTATGSIAEILATNSGTIQSIGTLTAKDTIANLNAVANYSQGNLVKYIDAITVTDTTATAADLNKLNGKVGFLINASSITSITGSATDIQTLYSGGGFTGLSSSASSSLPENATLTLSGSSNEVVDNLVGNINAASLTGSLSVTTGNAADNDISITTGSGATTITGTAALDTVTVNAASLTENTELTLEGSSNEVINNLVGNISASNLTGSLTVNAGKATDDNIRITTGRGDTTITASGINDMVTVNANAMADNTTLDINGSTTYTVSGLKANTNAAGASNHATLTYADISDDAASITTGSGRMTVTGTNTSDTLTINALALANDSVLAQSGAANQVVTNLVGDINATNLTGTLSVTTADNITDNDISITAGSGNTTIDASGYRDTIAVNASAMATNAMLEVNGSATYSVTNLKTNADVTGTSGTVNLTYTNISDEANNAATITAGGTGLTTVSGTSSTDTLTINALALDNDVVLAQSGDANQVVTNLVGDINATNLTGTLSVTTDDNRTDNDISITTGSGNVVVGGGNDSDTVNVTGLSANNQTFSAQSSTSNFNITAGANNQTITGSNTGNDTINGSSGNDTVSYAGGSNVAVTIGSYANQSGSSTGQGTDNFRNIENLVGTSGTDILNSVTSATNEVVTLTGANAGSIRDAASTSSFGFSSFEQIDLQGGNDTLISTVTTESKLNVSATNSGTLGSMTFSNIENVALGSGADTATISAAIRSVKMGSGNDTVNLSSKTIATTIDGEDGADTLNAQSDSINSTLNISDTNRGTLDATSFSSFEKINMGDGVDTATLGASVGYLNMGDGDDTVNQNSTTATTSIDGGVGIDTFTATNSNDKISINTSAQLPSNAEGNALANFETINTLDGNDSIIVNIRLDGVTTVEGEANNSIPMVGENFKPNLVVDGGAGYDKLDLSNGFDLTYAADFARSGGLGEFVNYAADSTGETLSSEFLSTKFTGFEDVDWDKTSQETASVSEVNLMGVQDTTVSSGADLATNYGVVAKSAANSSSVGDGVSSYSAGLSLGIEDSDFTAGDALSMTVYFGGKSSADGQSVGDDANAVAVGYGIGLDNTDLFAGSSLDLIISDASQVAADASSTTGNVFAVASNDGIGATDLIAIGDSAVDAVFTLNLTNSASAITTDGTAEAVGWMAATGLDDSSFTSGGIGLINVTATGLNGVNAESVTGTATADAFSAMVGVNNTSFNFADTSSTIASNLTNDTSASSSSIFGRAMSGLTSTVFGLFGGTTGGDTITNAQSVTSIIADNGFADAASVGGMASSIASHSATGISNYDITTSENLLLTSKNTVNSTASSSVVDA